MPIGPPCRSDAGFASAISELSTGLAVKIVIILIWVKQLASREVLDLLSELSGSCAQSPDDSRLIVRDPLRLFARWGCA